MDDRRLRLHLPSGFGEILNCWVKLGGLRSLPKYADVQLEVALNVDDPRGSDELVHFLHNVTVLGPGTHNTGDCLKNALPPHAELEPFLGSTIYPVTDFFLARGNRIEDYLPELPANFHFPLRLPEEARVWAQRRVAGDYLVVYPSSLSRLRVAGPWGRVWNAAQWGDLVVRLQRLLSIPVLVVGSERDQDMFGALQAQAALAPSQFVVGRGLADIAALIERCAYFVGFPAGPAVLAGVLGRPNCTLYREAAQKHMRGTFTDPHMLADGRAYLPFFTEQPGAVALEIANRLRQFQKPEPKLPPPIMQGVVEEPRTEIVSLLRSAAASAPNQTDPEAKLAYAFGSVLKPQLILYLGCDATPAPAPAALAHGSLDAGQPVLQLGVCGTPGDCLPQAHQALARSSAAARLPASYPLNADGEKQLAWTYPYPGYTLAVVDCRRADVTSAALFAFRNLAVPGYLFFVNFCGSPQTWLEDFAVTHHCKWETAPDLGLVVLHK